MSKIVEGTTETAPQVTPESVYAKLSEEARVALIGIARRPGEESMSLWELPSVRLFELLKTGVIGLDLGLGLVFTDLGNRVLAYVSATLANMG